MSSYPTEFQNPWGRLFKRVCSRRSARCKNNNCTTCVCDAGLVYFTDDDICDYPPILPASTSTTKVPASTSTANARTATTATGSTEVKDTTTTERVSSSPISTTSTSASSTSLKKTTEKSSTSFSTSTTNARTATTSTASTKVKDTTTTERVSSSPISTTKKTAVYVSSKPTTVFTTKDGSRPASSVSSSSADTSSTKIRTTPTTSAGSSSPAAKPTAAKTTESPGSKDKISAGSTSNTGLIVGICIGLLAIIICALVFLYLRRKNKCHKRIKSFGKDPCQVDLKDQSRTSTVESPTSPSYDYAYYESDMGAGPIGLRPQSQGMGNPVYGNKLRISSPFQYESETDGMPLQQPVYQEVTAEQVYADPDLTKVVEGGHQEPVYRVVDDEPQNTESPNSPIYREIDEAPIYAETVPDAPEEDATYPKQYQALNYATRDNVYQPLSDDWESRRYNK